MPGHRTVIFASFDSSDFQDPESSAINYNNDTNFSIINPTPATIFFTISSKNAAAITPSINFTSNGVDGFGEIINTFNLQKNNFVNQKIYFTARLKDNEVPFKREPLIKSDADFLIGSDNTGETFTIRLFNTNDNSLILRESDLTLDLLSGTNIPTDAKENLVSEKIAKFYTNFDSITSTGGGYFKGFLVASESIKNCRIRMIYTSGSTSSNEGTFNSTLTGYSDLFDIHPSTGLYDIRKVGEDNDQTQNYKDLIYQEVMLNKPNFFDKFLGQAVGNKDSAAESLGIKVYEKIENFVSNNTDPDYCNIKALISMFNSLDINFEDYNQQFPPSLTRLVDILSVNPSYQIKHSNQFQLNFDDKGFTSKTIFGKNKGSLLPFNTTILYTGAASKYILAYEKFSETYKLVNTNVLSATSVDYLSENTYPLSGVNESWGWGLVLPPNTIGDKVTDFYEFYDYDNTIEGSIIQDFIDYGNSNCTYLQSISSYNDVMGKDKIAESLLQHNLYSNCGLIPGIGSGVFGSETEYNVNLAGTLNTYSSSSNNSTSNNSTSDNNADNNTGYY